MYHYKLRTVSTETLVLRAVSRTKRTKSNNDGYSQFYILCKFLIKYSWNLSLPILHTIIILFLFYFIYILYIYWYTLFVTVIMIYFQMQPIPTLLLLKIDYFVSYLIHKLLPPPLSLWYISHSNSPPTRLQQHSLYIMFSFTNQSRESWPEEHI